MTQGNPNAIRFDVLVTILLQEDKSRKRRAKKHVADQAFVSSQRGNVGYTSSSSKPKVASSKSSNKSKKVVDKGKKKLFCKTVWQIITSLMIVQRSKQRRQRREK